MRLFVALDVPEDVREALGKMIERLKPMCRGARWVKPEAMHVTLKFIGHVEEARLDSIREALATVQWQGPVEMHFRGARFFPSERSPRVLASEVEASPNIGELAAEIDRTLVPLGIPTEGRTFAPHLTLARLKPGKDTEALVRAASEMASQDFGSARAMEFHLFESFLRPSGAEHRRVESYPLVKAAT
ncbi:MAG: RNA 2',3'-cyclic phosphodiesterase [Candidatus Acidiferrales bacterium]